MDFAHPAFLGASRKLLDLDAHVPVDAARRYCHRLRRLLPHRLVRRFLRAGRIFDFVGGCSLERAKVGEGAFTIDDRRYARLVLPWTASVAEKVRSVAALKVEDGKIVRDAIFTDGAEVVS